MISNFVKSVVIVVMFISSGAYAATLSGATNSVRTINGYDFYLAYYGVSVCIGTGIDKHIYTYSNNASNVNVNVEVSYKGIQGIILERCGIENAGPLNNSDGGAYSIPIYSSPYHFTIGNTQYEIPVSSYTFYAGINTHSEGPVDTEILGYCASGYQGLFNNYTNEGSNSFNFKHDYCGSGKTLKALKVEASYRIMAEADFSDNDQILLNGKKPDTTSVSNHIYNGLYYQTFNRSISSWRLPITSCDETIGLSFTSPLGYVSGTFVVLPEYATCALSIDSLTTTNTVFNPYSDVINITGIITETFGQSVAWTAKVAGRSFSGSGPQVSFYWDGLDSDWQVVPDGTYQVTLNAKTADGVCTDSKSISVTVKTSCDLKIDSLSGTSKILNPSSGGNVGINAEISDTSGQPISWSLNILDQTITGSGKFVNATWNGKYANGTVVDEGEYSATLTSQTADGKCTDSKTVNFTVTKAEEGQCGLYVQFGSSAHMASGNLSHSQELFSSRGGVSPVGVSLYYNSIDSHNGSLGRGWSHSYDVSLKENSDGSVLIREGNWRHKYYTLSNGVYTGQSGNNSALAKNSDGTFVLTHKDGQVYTFTNGKVASIADRNGNSTTFAYSASGNLATVTDPSGRTVTFTYDAANHLASLTDPSGNSYVLTVGDTLTSVTLPDGGAWNFSYDANAYMLTKTDPLGNITSYTYDDQHRAISSTDPEGRIRNITYPQTSDTVKSTSFTEKDGGVWNYSYDTQKGYLLSKTDPQGGVTSYGYDANGNRTSTTNPDGTGTTATYDNSGNMLTSTDALGQTTSYTYNAFGQVTGITDPQGGTTTYAYDIKGNLTTLTDPAGATTKYEYDTKGNITTVTDAVGQTTSFTYDSQGNLATVMDSSGAITRYTYDAAGNVTSITDAKGAVTQLIYDSRNRLIKSIDPNGNATVYSYDANGNKLSDTDANGNITRYEYNSKNQLIKTTDALGNSTIYSYGGSSCPSCGGGIGEKLTSLSDANGNVTMYLYDQLGRLTKETDPKGNETGYTYDAKGNLITKTDSNGNTISFSYDGNGRLLKKTYPDNTEESFTYDAKGNVLTATNKDIAYNFSYDSAGRMTSSMDSNSRYLQYSYDNTGKKTKTIYPEGSVVSYAYDGTGRLATITNGGGRTYGYSFDKLGRRTKTTYPTGATANYGYDPAGRLTSLVHKQSNGKIISSFSYTHDKIGNRLTKAEPDSKTSYAYDAIYRLLQALPTQKNKENDEGKRAETYSYDPTGNRLTGPRRQDAYTYGTGNQLLTVRRYSWSYDKNGNQTATAQNQPHTIDKEKHDDERQEYKNRTYTYDFENRLIKAETRHDDETTIVSFKYDPFGRRIGKTIAKLEHGKTEDTKTYTYVYDGQAIILEYETGTDEDHKQKTKTTKYVHGPNIDEPLSMQRDDDVYYYHSDGLGSVTALTDKKQKVVEKYEYDSFGNLKGDAKPMQPFTYTGREWDKETGLYYYRARYYDPMEGRFIQKDPIGFRGGINIYNYVGANPISYKDPFGLLRGPDLEVIMKFMGCMATCIKKEMEKPYGTFGPNSIGTDPGTWGNNLGAAIVRCTNECYPKGGFCKDYNVSFQLSPQLQGQMASVIVTVGTFSATIVTLAVAP